MIRKATVFDAEEIAEIHVRGWQEAYTGIVPDEFLRSLNKSEQTSKWKSILERSESETYVYENSDIITGWISFGPCRDNLDESIGEIWALYVSPAEWGKGIGRSLLNFVEDHFTRTGIKKVVLWVLERNLLAKSFYERCGFESDGSIKDVVVGNATLLETCYRKYL